MTNINDSYLLSAATTAANVLVVFVLFIISLFVVGSMTGVYLSVTVYFVLYISCLFKGTSVFIFTVLITVDFFQF